MSEANWNTIKSVGKWLLFMAVVMGFQYLVSWIVGYDFYLGNFIWEVPIVFGCLLWLLFAAFSAIGEGFFEYVIRSSGIELKFNEHFPFTLLRILFWLLIWRHVDELLPCVALGAMFPFIHDGVYYVTRNRLQPGLYKNGFWDYSITSGAVFDLAFRAFNRTLPVILRSLLFTGSLVYLIIHYL